jgi:hypothetical protein
MTTVSMSELTLRDGLLIPISPLIDGRPDGLDLTERDGERVLRILPVGSIPPRLLPSRGHLGPHALATHLRAALGEAPSSPPICARPRRSPCSSCSSSSPVTARASRARRRARAGVGGRGSRG